MTLASVLYRECPKLMKRMKQDEKEGRFSFGWPISSDKSQEYIGKILGRKVEGTESVSETWKEAESKL